MTESEKNIYNIYIKISRRIRNLPYQPRKKFENFKEKEKEKYINIKKLDIFFNKFPYINKEIYFSAPYLLYQDSENFDLNYFTTPKAIKTYKLYQEYLQNLSLDNNEQIENIKKSIKFIGLYCIEQKIPLNKYISYIEPNSIIYSWEEHIKTHKINIYCLFWFNEFNNIFYKISTEEKNLFMENISKNIISYKYNYNNSKKGKQIINELMKKLSKYIEIKLN